MPFLETTGARLYYELHGKKPQDAPAIVFAHGAGGNHLSWWQQVPHFRERYACLTFAHRGFGRSVDRDGRGGAAFADDLVALLDAAGIQRAHIIAQSMGGWTCLRFALQHPQRVQSLVLSGTFAGIAAPDVEGVWAASGTLISQLPKEVHPAAGARMLRDDPERHFLYTEIAATGPSYTRAELMNFIRQAGTVSLDELQSLSIPVTFIAGTDDVVFPIEYLEAASKRVPNARFVRINACGHSPYFERPEQFNAAVDAHLDAAR
jgi:3-oxoadipate enol-lactonase